ncbi:glycosyltransferase family 36 family protein [Asticcacaulis biprosthecium C19]|uniref:Glycosyltransferase family 36 family protein n=1 Tax=Asticcacaulis biprosthecium C19 TaxID=715226 RepID=F4QPX0_9CAUL|nr:glycosyltransferase family 36 family protein [Asticcacaulis biprosthecium]EGF90257.1 glycosyltransferase family 36 family protein [Asticcacaulis biprosthecium C19]
MSLIDFEARLCRLNSPTALPLAAGYLWNKRMMIHMNARGYATAQFMQPEPSKYARAQILEQKHFMLPEQGTYAHHPGRFFYLKDRDSGDLRSAPYEPVRSAWDRFAFEAKPESIGWVLEQNGLRLELELSLPVDEAVELWELRLINGEAPRRLSLYPAFPLGLMSWMSQSAAYDPGLNAIVGDCVTPYQKVADYFKNKDLKDKVFLLSEQTPVAFETRQRPFEGEGGLHHPDALIADRLANGISRYENPIAALQFDHDLSPGETVTHRFLFGPAFDHAEIQRVKDTWLSAEGFERARTEYAAYMAQGRGSINIDFGDNHLTYFVNTWLPRQVYYHGDTNRLTTDPQTRNFLQDALGNVYVRPESSRATLLKALSQQHANGSMPDGITLYDGAELKYINQVPHTDHCVWLPMLLEAYLDETGDYAVLDETVTDQETGQSKTVRDRVSWAMQWLIEKVDQRGLSFIEQGDWNDPMNMVGWKGKGVSGWLTIATAYGLKLWAQILTRDGRDPTLFEAAIEQFRDAANTHLWDGDWYGRGITDDGVIFGVKADGEGRIYLNPQSFALMAGLAGNGKKTLMIKAIEEQLETPYGVEMIAPAYTHMREDVGRLTQKFPGVAENGSVYNHAAAFYIYSLYQVGEGDKAFELLRKMLVGPDEADYLRRGQMPVFVPNYYRGAHRQFPDASGRSSHLFNTGTASWIYRSVIEGLFGLKGCREGLRISPQLPSQWPQARITRCFRGAVFDIDIRSHDTAAKTTVTCPTATVDGDLVSGFEAGKTYKIEVVTPRR